MAVLVCSVLCMTPDSSIADYVRKKFGDYCKALDIIIGSQCILIIATLIAWLWRVD
jgi:hypothetical protein